MAKTNYAHLIAKCKKNKNLDYFNCEKREKYVWKKIEIKVSSEETILRDLNLFLQAGSHTESSD